MRPPPPQTRLTTLCHGGAQQTFRFLASSKLLHADAADEGHFCNSLPRGLLFENMLAAWLFLPPPPPGVSWLSSQLATPGGCVARG